MIKKIKTIEIGASLLKENDIIAKENNLLLKENGVFALNVMGSPGSGKTSVLERTIEHLQKDFSLAVIEGDIKSSIDGERIEKFGIPVVQINTGGACHLDANMVRKGLESLPLKDIDVLFVENVGNLICPAEFRIGANVNIVVSSIPEGEEKPLKYPLMFYISAVCLLNKIDIVKYIEFNVAKFAKNLKASAPDTKMIPLSAKTGEGLEQWIDYLHTLIPYTKLRLKGRVAIIGLGDRMKGDDGAGTLAAEKLLIKKARKKNVKIINAENSIENYLGVVERFRPDIIVIIDAVDFGGRPGEIRVLKKEQIKETTTSTHTFSLPLLIEHIRSITGAECKVLGIQPKDVSFSETTSPEVLQAVDRIAKTLLM
jgi:hydrogenase nickel incorporation protein HypB